MNYSDFFLQMHIIKILFFYFNNINLTMSVKLGFILKFKKTYLNPSKLFSLRFLNSNFYSGS